MRVSVDTIDLIGSGLGGADCMRSQILAAMASIVASSNMTTTGGCGSVCMRRRYELAVRVAR